MPVNWLKESATVKAKINNGIFVTKSQKLMIYPKTWILRLEKLFTTRSFLFSSQAKGNFILRLSLQHGQSSAISYTSIDMQADENVENISRSYFAIFTSQRALRPELILYRTIRYAKILIQIAVI